MNKRILSHAYRSRVARRLVRFAFASIALLTLGSAQSTLAQATTQEALVIQAKSGQKPPKDAEKVYLSACLAVEREFRSSSAIRPRVTLILGAAENTAYWTTREIRLTKWSPELFAQGVVMFAFEDLMPDEKRSDVARRAVRWADSTVDARGFAK